MNPPDDIPSGLEPPDPSAPWPSHPELVPHETRNLLVLAVQQIVFRIGWMFKTESVITPAFLDAVSGAGWLRGCLPVLNRLGQSVPPVFWAERLRTTTYKKRALAAFIILMGIPLGVMSLVCFCCPGVRAPWLVALFLALYLVFFLFAGLYQVAYGTLQGKLIRPTRRGRLLWMSTFWGTLPVVAFALWLMPGWLQSDVPAFGWMFGFAAAGFLLSGLSVLFAFEPADHGQLPPETAVSGLRDTLQVLRNDANLRRLVLVIMLANVGVLLFPHYQALAREKLGLAGTHLVTWLVAQNISIGLFSVLVGRLADARGYRLTLQLLVVCSVLTPTTALGLAYIGDPLGARFYWCVFVALGVIPLGMRATVNYTLEICEPDQHARYLSTVSLCAAVPFLFSPV
ncbi:MAG: MFS transporter, partial [Pirellulales bacterium]|nr:MFS transporter [Pirellulales bacterium]